MVEIVTLGENELIDAPGFYRCSLDVHHSQCTTGVSVTSGILRKMELQTPADVWAFHMLNPNRWPSQDRPALRLGRAMAAFVEGQMEAVSLHFYVLPEDKPRRPTPAQITAYEEGRASAAATESVEFWREVDADPRDKITRAEMALIADMGAVLAADPAAAAVMGGEPELTMAWFDEETQLWCLARPDTINFDGTLTDYKRCSTQGRPFDWRFVDRRITDHGFDQQLAFGAEAMERLGIGWPTAAGIVAQWDQPPHHVILREIQEEDLRFGQFRNRRALRRFRECLDSGFWPGPGQDVGAYQRPEKQREWLLEQMQIAGTAP